MIERLKNITRQHPVISSIIIVVVVMAIRRIISVVDPVDTKGDGSIGGYVVVTLIRSYLLPLVLVILTGYAWIYRKGSFSKTMKTGIVVFLAIIVTSFLSLSISFSNAGDPVYKGIQWALPGLFFIFGIGFFEESVYRGLISNILGIRFGTDKKGVWTAVVISSLIFGFMHMSNMLEGVSFIPALAQSIVASAMGMMFCSIYFRGGNIWVLMLMHSIMDFGPLFMTVFARSVQTATDVINVYSLITLVQAIPPIIMTIFLLRDSKIPEVIERMKTIAEY